MWDCVGVMKENASAASSFLPVSSLNLIHFRTISWKKCFKLLISLSFLFLNLITKVFPSPSTFRTHTTGYTYVSPEIAPGRKSLLSPLSYKMTLL